MKSERIIFIDLLRGLAVLWMIETHVLDIVLAAKWKSGWLFDWLNQSNAYVAVVFLFCAGAGFWLTSVNNFAALKSLSKPLWIILRRLSFILVLGYWINLPFVSLHKILTSGTEALTLLSTCDILHVIVMSSLLALLLVMVSPNLKIFGIVSGIVALVIYFVAPIVWYKSPYPGLPLFVRAYFPEPALAKFPLFPWMGHFFAGVFLSSILFQAKNKKLVASIMLLLALPVAPLVFYVKALPFTYWAETSWWYCSPGNSLLRLRYAVILFVVFFFLETTVKSCPRILRFFQGLGQESLFVYLTQIIIIFGTAMNLGMRGLFPQGFAPWATVAIFFLVLSFCYIAAMRWQKCKETYPRTARLTTGVVAGAFVLLMLRQSAF